MKIQRFRYIYLSKKEVFENLKRLIQKIHFRKVNWESHFWKHKAAIGFGNAVGEEEEEVFITSGNWRGSSRRTSRSPCVTPLALDSGHAHLAPLGVLMPISPSLDTFLLPFTWCTFSLLFPFVDGV